MSARKHLLRVYFAGMVFLLFMGAIGCSIECKPKNKYLAGYDYYNPYGYSYYGGGFGHSKFIGRGFKGRGFGGRGFGRRGFR